MTVVGDLAQSTGPFARSSWDDVATSLEQSYAPEQRELEFGYRVPRQVMDLASQLLPLIAPGVEPPRVVRDAPADPVLIMAEEDEHAELAVRAAREYAGRGLSVGVVCPNQTRHLLVEAFESQQVKWHDSNNGALGQGINLVSAVDAKGLEFDAVVVVSPHVIVEEDSNGHRLLYIALTRTTRFLTVIHDGDPLAMTRPSRDHARDFDGTLARPERPIPPPSGGPSARATVPADGEPDVDAVEPPRNAGRVRSVVVDAVAENLANELRESVAAAMWPDVIDELRRRLGVTGEELPDRLE